MSTAEVVDFAEAAKAASIQEVPAVAADYFSVSGLNAYYGDSYIVQARSHRPCDLLG